MCYLRLLLHLAMISLIISLDYFDLDEYINSTLNIMYLSIVERNISYLRLNMMYPCDGLHIPIIEESYF